MPGMLVYFLIPLAVGAVAVVLLMGLFNLARGGSPQRSQSLMQWRIFLQAIALVIVFLTLWISGR